MKKLLLSLSFLLASAIAFAAPRSLAQMKAAAKSVLKAAPAATRGGSAQPEVLKEGRQLTVLGYAAGGFAVIANDDAFDAVLGYSDTRFSPDNMPPAMLWWMKATDEAMQQRLSTGKTTMTATTPADLGYPTEMGGNDGMMLAKWDQSAPYNSVIKEQLSGDYLTGCVATAMAQIMYHHKWPVKGTGNHNYNPDYANGQSDFNGTVSAKFDRTTYDWDNMLPVYTNGKYNDVQAEAVGTLMYHCGVSVEMQYGLQASGAHDNDVATALETYFSYSTKFYSRDIYTEREWMGIIYEEISNNRPVLYGGVALTPPTPSGHAFVFDGYDASGRVHVNWGWSGSGNGFFNVAVLDSSDGTLTEPTQNGFSYQQDMVVIHDADEPEIPYSSQFGILPSISWKDGSTSTGSFTVSTSGGTLTFNVTNLLNCDANAFTGTLGLIAEPVDGGAAIALFNGQLEAVPYSSGWPDFGTRSASIDGLPDGTYRVYLATKATQETDWQPVRSNETIVNNYLLTVSGGTATVTEGEPGWTTGIESVTVTGGNGDGTVRVYTADGVLVYTAPAAGFRLDDVLVSGLLIVKRGAETVKVVKK